MMEKVLPIVSLRLFDPRADRDSANTLALNLGDPVSPRQWTLVPSRLPLASLELL
jgi:hypothetical protein